MKNLKVFENHTQYEQYMGGGEVILPNVSYCVEENEVHMTPYDPTPPIPANLTITAYYNVDPGDTYGDWIFYNNGPEIEEMWIDGVKQDEIVETFENSGEHVVTFILKEGETSSLNFIDCVSMTSVTLPYGLTEIGTFTNCANLTSVTIPSSVTIIGNYVFQGCISLTSITIPNSVTSIDYGAFVDTPWWSSYSADTTNHYGNIVYINNVAVKAVSESTTSCNFKPTTVSIGSTAFSGCSLTSITLPYGLTSIGDEAFRDCSSLTSVTIPSSVTSIGNDAFYMNYGSQINSMVVEDGNTVYDSRNNCNAIIETSTNTMLYGCNNSTIPNGIVRIMNFVCNYSNLTTITIPTSVAFIGYGAFQHSRNLTSVTCLSTTPPQLQYSLYNGPFDDTNNCPIYVPSASVSTYKAASGWSTYSSRIRGI